MPTIKTIKKVALGVFLFCVFLNLTIFVFLVSGDEAFEKNFLGFKIIVLFSTLLNSIFLLLAWICYYSIWNKINNNSDK